MKRGGGLVGCGYHFAAMIISVKIHAPRSNRNTQKAFLSSFLKK